MGIRNMCDKCICDQLSMLESGTDVDVIVGGVRLEDITFLEFDMSNCCAKFEGVEEEEGQMVNLTIFIDCRDIQALLIEEE
ncbi:penicillin-binding protein [Psychrobacillus sp. FSL H8-0483]|uniref:penicillin-binding protein n=1 Tax=Psychrobacillus sp. FSL H8-0483 TaxID=2921389 RepID=UPI00315B2442